MKLSRLGERLTAESGTGALMRDLGEAMDTDEPLIMLGGGNPAQIPEVMERFRERLEAMSRSPRTLDRVFGVYDGPRGDGEFLDAVAKLLSREFGWPVTAKNVAVTNGSQSAFLSLFNLFGGLGADGVRRRIFLPMAPEYIGYGDQGLEPDLFVSRRTRIEHVSDRRFKYRLSLAAADMPEDIGAVCVSRPTNPTGNVLTEDELATLGALARERDVPLLVDNAYGTPFPDIIFGEARPVFDDHTVVCMSLSKLGLPGLRTGIVVASEPVVELIGAMTAVMSLAPSSMGPALVQPMFDNGEIVDLSRRVIRPWYAERARQACEWLDAALAGTPARLHVTEGAFFAWLWCEGIPVDSAELYARLRRRGVVVVPGHHFFPGLDDDWAHRHECLRLNYSQAPEDVRRGLGIVGEEVHRAYGG